MNEHTRELNLHAVLADGATAREAAESIYQFAVRHGLLSVGEGPPADVEDEAAEDAPVEAADRFEQQSVINTFRKRPIKLITYDNKNRLVTILTDRAIGARDRKMLPAGLYGTINVQYMASGNPEVRGSDHDLFAAQPYYIHNNRYACGGSVFPANRQGAGTLGALLRDAQGNLYGLTNNHVSGSCNHSEPGLPILAPGPADVGAGRVHPFTIGLHHELRPIHDGHPTQININDNLDVATFKILNDAVVTSMQGAFYDTPSTVRPIEGGARVEKVGRSTLRTVGTVLGPSVAPLQVYYDVKEYNIKKYVYFPGERVFVVRGDGDAYFSSPGDSGSLVTMVDGDGARHAVGIVFAGNATTRLSYVVPLEIVLERLGLSLVSEHGVT